MIWASLYRTRIWFLASFTFCLLSANEVFAVHPAYVCGQKLRQIFIKVSAIAEQELLHSREWGFSRAQEALMKEAAADQSLKASERAEKLWQTLTTERLKNAGAVTRFFMRAPHRTTRNQNSIYSKTLGRLISRFAGPHYNPILNRTSRRFMDSDLPETMVVDIHEWAHALDRNISPLWIPILAKAWAWDIFSVFLKTPIPPAVRFRMESFAIGAQWEFVHRMPTDLRQALVQEIKARSQSLPVEVLAYKEATRNLLKFSFAAIAKRLTPEQMEIWENPFSLTEYAMNSEQISTAFDRENLRIGFGMLLLQNKAQTKIPFVDYISPEERDEFIKLERAMIETKKTALICEKKSKKSYIQQLLISITQDIALASLENAALSKTNFVRAMQPTHGYSWNQLFKKHYAWGRFRKFLAYETLVAYSINLGLIYAWQANWIGKPVMYVPPFAHDLNFMFLQALKLFGL